MCWKNHLSLGICICNLAKTCSLGKISSPRNSNFWESNEAEPPKFLPLKFLNKKILWYRWWKKFCTTWDVWNPVNNGIFPISTGAGFLPSTVWRQIFANPQNGSLSPSDLFYQITAGLPFSKAVLSALKITTFQLPMVDIYVLSVCIFHYIWRCASNQIASLYVRGEFRPGPWKIVTLN